MPVARSGDFVLQFGVNLVADGVSVEDGGRQLALPRKFGASQDDITAARKGRFGQRSRIQPDTNAEGAGCHPSTLIVNRARH